MLWTESKPELLFQHHTQSGQLIWTINLEQLDWKRNMLTIPFFFWPTR